MTLSCYGALEIVCAITITIIYRLTDLNAVSVHITSHSADKTF